MTDNKNLIVAIALSVLVLLGWSLISERFFPTAEQPSTRVEDGRVVAQQQPASLPTGTPETPRTIRDRAVVLRETPRIAIETPSLRGSINLRGARIDDLVLTRHTETMAADSAPVRLYSPEGTEQAYFAHFGWQGQNVRVPDQTTVWQASGQRLTPATPVTLSWNNGAGQRFEIRLSVDENYLFTAEQHVINASAAPVAVSPFQLVNRIGASPDPDSWTMHVGPVGVFNGAADYENNYPDLVQDGQRRFSTTGGWVGFSDKYWLSALIPAQNIAVDAGFRYFGTIDSFQADVAGQGTVVAPGRGRFVTSHLFAGAKEVQVLETYQEQLGTSLDKAIDWGWFEWFMRPIFGLLLWLFGIIGNFGWAIIALVVIVRLILFPIAQKQFQSMGKMRALQPKIQALQERYQDDKPKLQEEMLRLYREEKANPAAGCLPILIQIPIFYALYKVLIVAVEMRHQPWELWVKDLAAPDPLTPVNLFGFLPFTPPSFLLIGILPILVGVTMWFQQKLNPPMPDPVQRQIFGLMPWILMVVMAPFAAGLQLYWATNNILSIAQQQWLYFRHPEMRMKPAGPTTPSPSPAPSLAKEGGEPRGRRKPKAR
ncbi:membrane protein insertase YidC [Sphingosinicella sp. YJ22]|uniref:membrane protein insertase YidC n=1 Tax=Sphingosinicella sp. YJ22 TaxID=1104780 RepID=UPI00140D8D20|nr:membrane protein insertase YidC [Sphingosinicella sp. YJ22]